MGTEGKHTGGPWKHDVGLPTCVWANGVWVASTNVETIDSLAEKTANAVLISAAPDLLASVNEFLAMRQAIIDMGGSEEPLDQEMIMRFAEMQQGVVDRALAAQAKARGTGMRGLLIPAERMEGK